MTLYELTNDYLNLLAMADDPDVDDQAFKDTLEGIEGALEDKADNYAKVIAGMKADADALKAEEARLKAKRERLEHRIDAIKGSLEGAMRATGKTKFKTLLYSFGIQRNPPSLEYTMSDEIPKESYVPAKYRIPQPDKIDTNAIKNDLKSGQQFDWCRLVQTESLRIK